MKRTIVLAVLSMLALCPPCRAQKLLLPEIPDTLRVPTERAAYLLRHFWDGLDFADTLRSRNRDFMEQHFADFISVFPHADTAALAPAVHRLLVRAEKDRAAWSVLTETAEKYLYEPDSPLFDEAYYRLFLEEIVRGTMLGPYEKLRPEYQLRMIRRNRPGSKAADFRFVDRNGTRQTLHGVEAERLLLLFYDPDCDHCGDVLREIRDSKPLAELTAAGRLTVLAVYPEGDRARWEATKSALPQEWSAGLDAEGILEHERYAILNLPALYLLDREKTVLLKEPSLAKLEAFLSENR